MFHLSDNELDRLGREAAEQYDVEQNTSGWDALERKLDKELPIIEKKRRRRFLFILTFLALVSGSGLTLLLLGSDQSEPVAGVVQSSTLQPANRLPDVDKATGINPSSAEPRTNEKAVSTDQPELNSGEALVRSKPGTITDNNSPSNQTQKTIRNRTLTNKGGSDSRSRSRATRLSGSPNTLSGPETVVTRNADGTTKTGRLQVYDAVEEELHSVKTASVQQVVRAQAAPYTVTAPALSIPETVATTNKKEPKKSRFLEGLEFGVLGGPDMSNVHFTAVDDPGFNIGISAQYRFSPRWSVTTGLIYTKKLYTADGDDYHPPKDYWTYNTTLHTVEGSCEMLEIPLALRYDLSRSKVNRYFVSAGLSSYLMNEETYEYYYTYNGIYMNRERAYDSNVKYFLSIAHLSAGFEKSISNKFSFQVEPYLKIPMKGIGFGDMHMNSYGIYFSFKYKPFAGSPVPDKK